MIRNRLVYALAIVCFVAGSTVVAPARADLAAQSGDKADKPKKNKDGDDKKDKTSPAPKAEPPPKDKSASSAAPPKDDSKAESGETAAAAPSNYSRGEGQKPVSKAYRDNWNVIFGKKKR